MQVPAHLARMPGVPSRVPDFMQGEVRDNGVVLDVAGWHRWSDRKKLRWMRDLAERYAQDPEMNTWVAKEVLQGQGIASRDYAAQAAAILRWVQRNVYYVNEPGEIIRTPWRVLKDRVGDCDDMAILLATMAHTIGLPWRFILAGQKRGSGEPVSWTEGTWQPWFVDFNHIYVQFGWPPFSEKNPIGLVTSQPMRWGDLQHVSAEPTIANAPLGYDVVRDGAVMDANGAAQIPELMRGRMAGWVAGTYAGPDGEAVAPGPEPAWLVRFWRDIDWWALAVEAFRATVVALVVGGLTPVLQRKARKLWR